MSVWIRVSIAICGLSAAVNVSGCAEEERDVELRDTSTDADDATGDSDAVLHDGLGDSSDLSDVEGDADSGAVGEDVAMGDVLPDADTPGDTSEPCTMGVTPSEGGCPCDTHLLQCCWGGLHIECVAPPGESYSAWIQVHDADWNCDELPSCEDFEGVPAP